MFVWADFIPVAGIGSGTEGLEKRKRLERLESAMERIERVRGLLAPPPRK